MAWSYVRTLEFLTSETWGRTVLLLRPLVLKSTPLMPSNPLFRPVILDPAEPTGDVGGGDRWCWNLLAKEATEWLFSLCFKDGAGNLVRLWKVPVRII